MPLVTAKAATPIIGDIAATSFASSIVCFFVTFPVPNCLDMEIGTSVKKPANAEVAAPPVTAAGAVTNLLVAPIALAPWTPNAAP